MLILGWGYQPECVQAGIYLLFYTLLASLPLLVGILFVYNYLYSLCLFLLCGSDFLSGGLFYVCIIFAFLVRMPMFMVRLWLPRAHVHHQHHHHHLPTWFRSIDLFRHRRVAIVS